ncbi:MAG: polyprenyl synthetase solanesyl diphosphate synthase [Lachnospiraceae bacterium]|jgi:hypothetical protein
MRERKTTVQADRRLLDATGVCVYLSLGRNRGIEFAKSIGAERKIGRRCLYDKKVIDEALDAMTE